MILCQIPQLRHHKIISWRVHMKSITKTNISKEQIIYLVKKGFGQEAVADDIVELEEGFFNTAYLVTVNGTKTVLKVAPPKDVAVMRYEKNLMRNEVTVLRAMSETGKIPVPRVLYYDTDRDMIDNEYFFMEFVQGSPMNNIHENLTEVQKQQVSEQLGKIAKEITNVYSEYFGDISNKEKQFPTWKEAFNFMIAELVKDAREKEAQLPIAYDEIGMLFNKHSHVLDKVEKASLVHKDLWMGNIFIDEHTAEIKGIVDCERAVYGDVLLEPVCGFLLEDSVFMNNFYGKAELTSDEKIRTMLYRFYLLLIMIIECSFRLYEDDWLEKWAREQLGAAIADLAGLQ